MLKFSDRSGGPEEDRTPDLLIANDTVTREINNLRRCNNVVNSVKTGGECTNRAQSVGAYTAGFTRPASNGPSGNSNPNGVA
jgi:hypothetical protein